MGTHTGPPCVSRTDYAPPAKSQFWPKIHESPFQHGHPHMRGASAKYLILEPPYPTLHKYDHSTSETSCVSTGNVRGASAKYWS